MKKKEKLKATQSSKKSLNSLNDMIVTQFPNSPISGFNAKGRWVSTYRLHQQVGSDYHYITEGGWLTMTQRDAEWDSINECMDRDNGLR